jgi:hypothetical protein
VTRPEAIRRGLVDRLADAYPYSAARFYGFGRTARRIGDVPIDLATVTRVLKAAYARELEKILMEDRPSPLLAALEKHRTMEERA